MKTNRIIGARCNMTIIIVLILILHTYYLLLVQPSSYEQFDKFLKLGTHDYSTNHSKFEVNMNDAAMPAKLL